MTRPDDTGQADPRLARALAAGDRAEVLAALADARVFATITATATGEETGAHGLRQESSAEMAVVLLQAPDGRRALPVFSDLGALKRWRLDGRPVPLTGPQACQAALDEGADAVVVDPAGPAFEVRELTALAQGFVPVPGADVATRRADTSLGTPTAVPHGLVDALRRALKGEAVAEARLLQGPDGLVLGVVSDLDPAALAGLAQRLVGRLGPALPAEGLDLAPVARGGAGVRVLPRRWLR